MVDNLKEDHHSGPHCENPRRGSNLEELLNEGSMGIERDGRNGLVWDFLYTVHQVGGRNPSRFQHPSWEEVGLSDC